MSEGQTTPPLNPEGEFQTPLMRTPEQERDRKGRFRKSLQDMSQKRQSALDLINSGVSADDSDDEQADIAATTSHINRSYEKNVRIETLKDEKDSQEYEQQQIAMENDNEQQQIAMEKVEEDRKTAMQSASTSHSVNSTLLEVITLLKDFYLTDVTSGDKRFLRELAKHENNVENLIDALLEHHERKTAEIAMENVKEDRKTTMQLASTSHSVNSTLLEVITLF